MLQDLRRGKRCEIDFINGVVCEYGERCGVPTPYNAKTVSLVHEIEEGKREIGFENIDAYRDL